MMKNNSLPLTGLTILITRPLHQSQRLSQFIESKGGKSIIFPLFDIEPTHQQPAFQQIIKRINNYDIAIFVSANAVTHAMPFWHPQKPLTIIAIGPGTASALERHHIKVDLIPSHFSSEGLLALPIFSEVLGKKIIIFCGENSRNLLRHTLTQHGALVQEAICYRRRPREIDASQRQSLISQPIDYIVTTSQESLLHLFSLLKSHSQWLCQIPLLVISAPMTALAKELGFHKVITADNATDDAVVQALMTQVE